MYVLEELLSQSHRVKLQVAIQHVRRFSMGFNVVDALGPHCAYKMEGATAPYVPQRTIVHKQIVIS